ncbi:MAG: YjbQ family protein [Gammaproteobacteria bacterium]|nr:YjbQ family protein [Gammaproteobacteria bacterium]
MNLKLRLRTDAQGLSDITQEVAAAVRDCGVRDGLATLYIRHTSASLLIQENADPCVQRDLEHWLNRLVPEDDALYTHTAEGPDDMPAHIKSALTATSLSIPMVDGELALGTWQGIFLWEHRHHRGERQLLINVLAG